MPLYALDGERPRLPAQARAFVAPNAIVIGRVELREDANVWFGCTLRGDNEWITVGERTNVQDGSILHTDMGFPLDIGADCTIGHNVILHGCTIGEGALIGAGAVVTKNVPPGATVAGVPARVLARTGAQAARSQKEKA